MKKFICLFLSIITVLSLVACTQNAATTPNDTAAPADNTAAPAENTDGKMTPEEIGTVIFGTDGAYPPFNYVDDNDELTGFEVAMIKEIANRTGLDIKIEVTAWSGIFGQLDSGKIDSVVCCIFPSVERLEKYDFCREYIYDDNYIIVKKGEGSKYKTIEDLKGLKVGVTGGGNSFARLEEVREQGGFEIVTYEDELEPFDLKLGRIDAYYKSPVSALVNAKKAGIEVEPCEIPALEHGSCSFPFLKDNARAAAIRELFTDAINSMIEDGTMKSLCEEWLGIDVTAYEPLHVK